MLHCSATAPSAATALAARAGARKTPRTGV